MTLICFGVGIASAQGSPPASSDSARCEAALNAPTSDTAIVEYRALFFPFDSARNLPVFYREILGQGLQQELKLQKPLPVSTYQGSARGVVASPSARDYAVTTLRSFYRFALHGNGRLTNIRAVGGVRNAAFDEAVIGALTRLDSMQMLPPGTDSIAFEHDTLEVRLTITPGFMAGSHYSGKSPTNPGATPLFRLRVPVRPVEKDVAALPDNPRPRYPKSARDHHVGGEVRAEFIVRRDGTPDPASIQFVKATGVEFATAVAAVLPSMHFYPMEVAGCKVAALIQMPFLFAMN